MLALLTALISCTTAVDEQEIVDESVMLDEIELGSVLFSVSDDLYETRTASVVMEYPIFDDVNNSFSSTKVYLILKDQNGEILDKNLLNSWDEKEGRENLYTEHEFYWGNYPQPGSFDMSQDSPGIPDIYKITIGELDSTEAAEIWFEASSDRLHVYSEPIEWKESNGTDQ